MSLRIRGRPEIQGDSPAHCSDIARARASDVARADASITVRSSPGRDSWHPCCTSRPTCSRARKSPAYSSGISLYVRGTIGHRRGWMRETIVLDLVQAHYMDATTPLRSICSRIYAHRSYNKTRNKTRSTCAHKWHGAGRTRAFLSSGAHLCTSAERRDGIG